MSTINHAMKFNHISFPSTQVEATAAFFEQYLGCTITSLGAHRVVKRHDFDIVIEEVSTHPVDWPESFHIGFEVPTLQDITDLYNQFLVGGARLSTGLLRHPRGSRFFCQIPGGVNVEINTREDADERFRASFGR